MAMHSRQNNNNNNTNSNKNKLTLSSPTTSQSISSTPVSNSASKCVFMGACMREIIFAGASNVFVDLFNKHRANSICCYLLCNRGIRKNCTPLKHAKEAICRGRQPTKGPCLSQGVCCTDDHTTKHSGVRSRCPQRSTWCCFTSISDRRFSYCCISGALVMLI